MKVQKFVRLITTGFLFCFFAFSIQAQTPFPENCWGVYSWAGWNPEKVTKTSHPLIKGAPLILKWSQIESRPGVFNFDEQIGQKLKLLKDNDFYTFIMIWVAPNSPRWLYENGVPELEMTKTLNPLGEQRNQTFPYYLDDDYIRFYHRMLTEFGKYVKQLPKELQSRILYIQSAEGSTGDGEGYKGKPLDPKYNITNEQWGTFRIKAWDVLKNALTDKNTGAGMVKPVLVNYDSNNGIQYNWLLDNFDIIGLKNGMFSHGYHISETNYRLQNWQNFKEEVQKRKKQFFSRGEQDGEWAVYGWSTKNPAQAFYWSSLFATHCGLDMWNVPAEASEGKQFEPALKFFNKYAGQHDPATAQSAFCAFQKGLDASDTIAFPVPKYGEASKNNISRYMKIAEDFKVFGAVQGDPEKAIGEGMLNRKRQDYNDVGWGISPGNYSRFLTQIDPESTSSGWWHKGPPESVYSQFSRSINTNNKSKAIYFDVDDNFLVKSKSIEVRIVWLDEGVAEWTLLYDALDAKNKKAFSIKNTNSGIWKEKTFLLEDPFFNNRGENNADIFIRTNGNGIAIFHLIELNKKS